MNLSNHNWVQTVDLCRYFKRANSEVRAIDEVSLGLSKGEFLAIVGASGSGKSTMLSILGGLDRPTSGKVLVEGSSLFDRTRRELAAYRAHTIGMVFQAFNLISHYTALQNVETALLFNNTPRQERTRLALSALDQLGLTDRMTHRPSDLSGGEQQRVAIARAIVKKPAMLLADEPTGNLDHDNAVQIVELLSSLNKTGLTVVMVTHNMQLARDYASRIIKMNYGKVVDDVTVSGREET